MYPVVKLWGVPGGYVSAGKWIYRRGVVYVNTNTRIVMYCTVWYVPCSETLGGYLGGTLVRGSGYTGGG